MTGQEPVGVLDVEAGMLGTALPPLTPPVFLRLQGPAGALVDGARRRFLACASADLNACSGGWHGGPGVFVDRPDQDRAALTAEVHEVARALRALADEAVARSYLEIMESRVALGDASTEREGE